MAGHSFDEVGDECNKCGHSFDPHIMIATTHDFKRGGIILCPELGCQCYSTWAVQGYFSRDDVVVPPKKEVQRMRDYMQVRALDDEMSGNESPGTTAG